MSQAKIFLLFMLLPLLAGCVTHNFEHIRKAATGINAGESIVILGRQNHLGYEADVPMVECLTDRVRGLNVMDGESFIDYLYPWFEPRIAPNNVEEMKVLLGQPEIAKRLEIANIRYLAWVEGEHTNEDKSGSMACAAGTGFGGCFGFLLWDNKAKYEVTIWDLQNKVTAGQMRNEAHGTSAVVGALIPIPLIASVRRESCGVIARNLSSFIRDTKP